MKPTLIVLALLLTACGTIPLAGYDPATRTLRFNTLTEVRNECDRRGAVHEGPWPQGYPWLTDDQDAGCYDRRTRTTILWTRSFTTTERHESCHAQGWRHGEPWPDTCQR